MRILILPLLLIATASSAEPVRGSVTAPCAAYGPGFVAVSGGSVCVKFSGYVMTSMVAGKGASGATDMGSRTRLRVEGVARTQTDFGPLSVHGAASVER